MEDSERWVADLIVPRPFDLWLVVPVGPICWEPVGKRVSLRERGHVFGVQGMRVLMVAFLLLLCPGSSSRAETMSYTYMVPNIS